MIGLIGLVALLAFCVLLYFCAVYVVPFAVGVWIAFWAIHAGSGEIGGFAIGAVAGIALFLSGKVTFQTSRSGIVRWLIATAFGVPAAIAGFNLVQQVWPLVMTPMTWQYVVGVMVAAAAGATVITRLDGLAGNGSRLSRPQ
ncbi:MAG: hypothetical protein HYX38_31510 [Rhodospirillales bacterium]|nr:hypothetical protein [Rhodospirillales bacterium]